jgi:hypothetical protein
MPGKLSLVSRGEAHSFERVLTAIATNERVASCLSEYPDDDQAIRQLRDDVERQRRDLVREFRAIAQANAPSSIAARLNRDASLLGAWDV